MDVAAFKDSSTGQIIRTLTGYDAFIPNRLPPRLDFFDMEFVQLVSDAERALGELAGLGRLLPNPNFLVIPYMGLEAVASSRIEGTQASLSELFYFEAASEKPTRNADVVEVHNYFSALKFGLSRLETLPLSLRLVREVHERLMTDVRGGSPDKTPGDFRRSQNWIGPAGCTLQDATYVPPPPDRLMEMLGDWEKFLHERSLPLLIQCALMHYQFEAIHPFLDGNGRVGRLMVTLFLCERKALSQPLLYLSAYFERYRDEYYSRLLNVSQRGEWKEWLRFFLRAVFVQSQSAIESAKQIIDRREKYRLQLQRDKASASALALLDFTFTNPYLRIPQVSQSLRINFHTAHAAIAQLEELGILEEITGQKRNRIYVARQLLNLLARNEPIYKPDDE